MSFAFLEVVMLWLRRSLALSASLLFLLCGACNDSSTASTDENLLPNEKVRDREHDGESNKEIALAFGAQGYDLHVDPAKLAKFAPAWPITSKANTVLSRFGTPIRLAEIGYYHTGFDVMRADPKESASVLAPHDGLAFPFDWTGTPGRPKEKYSGVVAIYDPVTHVVTQLMHVDAIDALARSKKPVAVKRGQVIGTLAPVPIDDDDADRLRHTHVTFVDGESMKILNPAKYFKSYRDTIAPVAERAYIADAKAKVSDKLVNGQLDVVLEVFDRDNLSPNNQEISAVEFQILDQVGRVVRTRSRCNFDQLYESIGSWHLFRTREFVDFGSAVSQMKGLWTGTDIDNPDRTFRYALTQLSIKNGRCVVADDDDAFITVKNDVTKLRVRGTIWDVKENRTEFTFDIRR